MTHSCEQRAQGCLALGLVPIDTIWCKVEAKCGQPAWCLVSHEAMWNNAVERYSVPCDTGSDTWMGAQSMEETVSGRSRCSGCAGTGAGTSRKRPVRCVCSARQAVPHVAADMVTYKKLKLILRRWATDKEASYLSRRGDDQARMCVSDQKVLRGRSETGGVDRCAKTAVTRCGLGMMFAPPSKLLGGCAKPIATTKAGRASRAVKVT